MSNNEIDKYKHHNDGFTLIELLFVIAVISVLAALSVSVITSAAEDSRESATRARILQIQRILEVELEDYEIRRSPISLGEIGFLTAQVDGNVWARRMVDGTEPSGSPQQTDDNFFLHARNLRRMIINDLIKSELPSGRGGLRPSGFPSDQFVEFLTGEDGIDQFDDGPRPGNLGIPRNIVEQVFRNSETARAARWRGFAGGPPSTPDPSLSDAEVNANGAELLFEILSTISIDGTPAIDAFGASAIGDTDSDGMPEIVDAWGDPLVFEFQQLDTLEQERIPKPTTGPKDLPDECRSFGIWDERDQAQQVFADFSGRDSDYKPNLVTDLRPFLSSENIFQIDGEPIDFIATENQ